MHNYKSRSSFVKYKISENGITKDKKGKTKEKLERQNRVELRELQFRPNIDVHDPNVKLKKAQEFIDDGDKVKIVMRLRGREISKWKNVC